MSEYWKSTPKYWCKHCSAYVRDTPFERRQHESTAKHQNNLKRSLRDIQNNHERGEREKENAKAEVERLNRVVGGATPGQSKAPSTTSTTVTKGKAAAPTAADQKRQWAQLAEMGIQVPDQFRGEMAMAGDWKVVSQVAEDGNTAIPSNPPGIGVRKRKLDEEEQEEVDSGEATAPRKAWGKSVRTYPGQDSPDLDDLLSGTITLKGKKEVDVKAESPTAAQAPPTIDEAPVETTSERATLDEKTAPALATQERNDESPPLVKSESAATDQDALSLVHNSEATAPPVFKKRKGRAAPPT